MSITLFLLYINIHKRFVQKVRNMPKGLRKLKSKFLADEFLRNYRMR